MRFGALELVLIIVLVLLFVGPKQLPRLTQSITDSVKSFRKELKDGETECEESEAAKETIDAKETVEEVTQET